MSGSWEAYRSTTGIVQDSIFDGSSIAREAPCWALGSRLHWWSVWVCVSGPRFDWIQAVESPPPSPPPMPVGSSFGDPPPAPSSHRVGGQVRLNLSATPRLL